MAWTSRGTAEAVNCLNFAVAESLPASRRRIGSWLSRDPSGESGGLNLYGYVGNSPIDRIDPFGLWQITIFGGRGFGGYLTFGYSPSTGQWNAGVRGGAGIGFNASWDLSDQGCQPLGSGWSGNLSAAGGIGNGAFGASGEGGMNFPLNGYDAYDAYGTVGGRFGPFSGSVTGGMVQTPYGPNNGRSFYGPNIGHGFSNYGGSGFAGIGVGYASQSSKCKCQPK